MSKSKKPTDLDAGMEPEKVPAPGREPRETDRDWPAPGVPLSEAGGVEPPAGVPVGEVADVGSSTPAVGWVASHAVGATEEALLALEARCAAGGSATLDDIRAVLAALRGA